MKSVLVDFHNLIFRNFFVKDVGGHTTNPDYALWRFMIIDSIYQQLHRIENVSEIVIAADDKNSWRRAYFPRYKESRKKQRDRSDVNWEVLFNQIEGLILDLKDHMPFKVIKINSAEADDVIATIVMENDGNDFVISSNDEDFLQLCSDNVKIWNPSKREYVVCEDTEDFVIKKCLMGQSKDDIFNVKTPNNWGQTEASKDKRKPGFGPKSVEKVMSGNYKVWLKEQGLEENFHRNRVLMDFRLIPNTLRNRVLKAYDDYIFPPPGNIYQFFKKHNMRKFLEDFTNVENKLMELY
jgi:hypothetical protein